MMADEKHYTPAQTLQLIADVRDAMCEPERLFISERDDRGNIYVRKGNTVQKISPDGCNIWEFDGHSAPVLAVAVDADNYAYSISADKTVRKISQDGFEVWCYNYGLEHGSGNITVRKVISVLRRYLGI